MCQPQSPSLSLSLTFFLVTISFVFKFLPSHAQILFWFGLFCAWCFVLHFFLLFTEFFSSRISVWFFFRISISVLSFSLCSWFQWIVFVCFIVVHGVPLKYFLKILYWINHSSPHLWLQLLGDYRAPRWLSGKESACPCRRCWRCGFDAWVGKITLEKDMATYSSILARKILWTQEPGGLESMELQGVGLNWAHTHWLSWSCVMFPWFFMFLVVLYCCLHLCVSSRLLQSLLTDFTVVIPSISPIRYSEAFSDPVWIYLLHTSCSHSGMMIKLACLLSALQSTRLAAGSLFAFLKEAMPWGF